MSAYYTFWALALCVGFCSVCVVTLKHPVTAAIALVCDLFLLAAIYALQGAEFIATVQVVIYAGAIVVLFMFMIMLLNLDLEADEKKKVSFLPTVLLSFVVLVFLGLMGKWFICDTTVTKQVIFNPEHTSELALELFKKYLWPFELASMLILLAILACVQIVAKKSAHEKQRLKAIKREGVKP